jgi:hypothetical protein
MSSCYFVFNNSVLLCPNLYSTNLYNSLTAPNCTSLVSIRLSTANRLQISQYHSTHKVFMSHVKSLQVDFSFLFNFNWTAVCRCISILFPELRFNTSYRLSLYRLRTDTTENAVYNVDKAGLSLGCLAIDVLLLSAIVCCGICLQAPCLANGRYVTIYFTLDLLIQLRAS